MGEQSEFVNFKNDFEGKIDLFATDIGFYFC